MKRLLKFFRRTAKPGSDGARFDTNGVAWFVDRWSYYRGTLHGSGWFNKPDSAAASTALCRKRTHEALPNITASIATGLPSPDVAAHFGHAYSRCRFELTAQFKDGQQALEAGLQIRFEDGTVFHIDEPAGPKISVDPYHKARDTFFNMLSEKPSATVVELGSRARSGNIVRDLLPKGVRYVGADIMSGPNVDVVCDAHRLSEYFEPDSIDAVFSISVFEHLLMPWKVALEMNRILKPGGLVLTMAPQGFPLHDMPWDYWRFSEFAWHGIFNAATGFEIVKVASGERTEMVADLLTPITLGFGEAYGFIGTACICRKIATTDLSWPVDMRKIVSTMYPA